MAISEASHNFVREFRMARGLTQASLAERAGISRTAVTAIEGRRLVPSVAAALALADALGTSVEKLFGKGNPEDSPSDWAVEPPTSESPYWEAEVDGRRWLYPAATTPMLTPLPDGTSRENVTASIGNSTLSRRTLVIACCDPAAGLLASQFTQLTGMRLLVIPRSSRQAIELLRQGKVHAAGLHLSTRDDPGRNVSVLREMLGCGYQLLHIARWQEGVAAGPSTRIRSVRGAIRAKLNWIGREEGSGARACLDQLLGDRPRPSHLAQNHRGVAEAVRSGWADVGVCLQLASVESGLDFFPVQEEVYDLCVPSDNMADPMIQSLLRVVRSVEYRRLLGQLPGYDSAQTGELGESC